MLYLQYTVMYAVLWQEVGALRLLALMRDEDKGTDLACMVW